MGEGGAFGAESLVALSWTHPLHRRFPGITWEKQVRKWRCELQGLDKATYGRARVHGNYVDTQEQAAQQYAW